MVYREAELLATEGYRAGSTDDRLTITARQESRMTRTRTTSAGNAGMVKSPFLLVRGIDGGEGRLRTAFRITSQQEEVVKSRIIINS